MTGDRTGRGHPLAVASGAAVDFVASGAAVDFVASGAAVDFVASGAAVDFVASGAAVVTERGDDLAFRKHYSGKVLSRAQ